MNKDFFLIRYNDSRDRNTAISKSINASVGRNPTYSSGLNSIDKIEFKNYWRVQLVKIGVLFETERDEKYYLSQVESLTGLMNSKFRDMLNPQRSNYEAGFRVAHAQKSISVYLKHLWCMGEIPAPPCCPIDRIISLRANVKLEVSWTRMNSIDQVKRALDEFRQLAKNDRKLLCDWELDLF